MTHEIPSIRLRKLHKAADLGEPFPVSWAVYNSQYFGAGDTNLPLYAFNFTRIDSDMWSRVSGELSVYVEWVEGDPEDKDEWPVVLKVSVEPDIVEDGFVTIAFWLRELFEWAEALNSTDKQESS